CGAAAASPDGGSRGSGSNVPPPPPPPPPPTDAGTTTLPSHVSTVSHSSATSSAATSWLHTTSADTGRFLVVRLPARSQAEATVKYGSQTLTSLAENTTGLASNDGHTEIWVLVNPPTGTASIAVTLSKVADVAAGAAGYIHISAIRAATGTQGESDS